MYCREGKSKITGKIFWNFFQNSNVILGSAVRGENLLDKFEKTSANSESHDRLAIDEEITQKRFLKKLLKNFGQNPLFCPDG